MLKFKKQKKFDNHAFDRYYKNLGGLPKYKKYCIITIYSRITIFQRTVCLEKIIGAGLIIFSNILIFYKKGNQKLDRYVILDILSNIIYSVALFLDANI